MQRETLSRRGVLFNVISFWIHFVVHKITQRARRIQMACNCNFFLVELRKDHFGNVRMLRKKAFSFFFFGEQTKTVQFKLEDFDVQTSNCSYCFLLLFFFFFFFFSETHWNCFFQETAELFPCRVGLENGRELFVHLDDRKAKYLAAAASFDTRKELGGRSSSSCAKKKTKKKNKEERKEPRETANPAQEVNDMSKCSAYPSRTGLHGTRKTANHAAEAVLWRSRRPRSVNPSGKS